MGETGTENLTWVLALNVYSSRSKWAVTKQILAHKKTLVEEPPIKTGTPEPYVPQKKSR